MFDLNNKKLSLDAKKMGFRNKSLILDHIRNNEPVSRVEVARNNGLSKTAVSNVVEELLRRGLIKEQRHTEYSKVGRKPQLLTLNEDALYFLLIDIGGTKIDFVVADFKGDINNKWSIDTAKTWNEVTKQVVKHVDLLEKRVRVDSSKLGAISIGVPGVVDDGVVKYAPNIGGPPEFSLQDEMNEVVDLPVFIENDVNMAVLGEMKARDYEFSNLIFISVGTGIGAGLVLDGELYKGESGRAGEIGWVVVNPSGLNTQDSPRNDLGQFEELVSGPSLIEDTRQALSRSNINNENLKEKIYSQAPGSLFKYSDEFPALNEVRMEWIKRVSAVAVSVHVLLDLDLVVFGGGVFQSAQYFLEDIKEFIAANTQVPPKIERSKVQNAPLVGGIEACYKNLPSLIWGGEDKNEG